MKMNYLVIGFLVAGATAFAEPKVGCKSANPKFKSYFARNEINQVDCSCSQEDFKKLHIPTSISTSFKDSLGQDLTVRITGILTKKNSYDCMYSVSAVDSISMKPNVVNPAQEQMSLGLLNIAKVEVFDTMGRLVRQDTFDGVNIYKRAGKIHLLSFWQGREPFRPFDPFFDTEFEVINNSEFRFHDRGWPRYTEEKVKVPVEYPSQVTPRK